MKRNRMEMSRMEMSKAGKSKKGFSLTSVDEDDDYLMDDTEFEQSLLSDYGELPARERTRRKGLSRAEAEEGAAGRKDLRRAKAEEGVAGRKGLNRAKADEGAAGRKSLSKAKNNKSVKNRKGKQNITEEKEYAASSGSGKSGIKHSDIQMNERLKNCILTYEAVEDLSYKQFVADMIEEEESEPIIELESVVFTEDITGIIDKINRVFDTSVMPVDYVPAAPVNQQQSASQDDSLMEVEVL